MKLVLGKVVLFFILMLFCIYIGACYATAKMIKNEAANNIVKFDLI